MKIFGKKTQMTRVEVGVISTPVTLIDVTDNVVARLGEQKSVIAWGQKKKATKAEMSQYKGLGFAPVRAMEVTELPADVKVGDKIVITELPEKVAVTGISKGKGFAGVVKRYGFGGGPKTHGQSDRLRAPGSIGAGTDPGRVLKGTRMAGRMGSDTVKVRNLKVVKQVEIDGRSYLLVKGSVPGAKGTLVNISW